MNLQQFHMIAFFTMTVAASPKMLTSEQIGNEITRIEGSLNTAEKEMKKDIPKNDSFYLPKLTAWLNVEPELKKLLAEKNSGFFQKRKINSLIEKAKNLHLRLKAKSKVFNEEFDLI